MSREFRLPDLGEGIHEAEIVEVLVKVGDEVKEEQPILRVETDKATVEITSPYGGKVEQIAVKVDDRVRVGDVLIVFSGGEGSAAPAPRPAEAAPPPPPAEGPAPAPKPAEAAPPPPPAKGPAPVPRPAEAAPPPPPAREGPVPAAPATRKLAREMGVDLRLVPGSGPGRLVTAEDVRAFAAGAGPTPPAPAPLPVGRAEGLPAQAPREAAAEKGEPSLRPVDVVAPPLPDFTQWGPVERMPLRSIRRAIARHMALSWSQIPHVSHQDLADITALEEMRQRYQSEVEARGGKLTLTVFAMKAAVVALKAFPRFNSSLDPDAEEVILKKYYHIGVATDTERGLIVPVIRNVDCKSVVDLAVELYETAQRVRQGEVSLEEMRGSTFTITNIGALGGTGFAPIVNYPDVAILGLARARLQPVVRTKEDGTFEMVPRLLLPVILAFDHRVLDGAEAARFTRKVIEELENPERLLIML